MAKIHKEVEKFAEENLISIYQACGAVIQKEYYIHNRKIADIGQKMLMEGEESVNKVVELNSEDGLYLVTRLTLGKGKFQALKVHWKTKGVVLPTYQDISRLRKSIFPKFEYYKNPAGNTIGLTLDLSDAIKKHLMRGLQFWKLPVMDKKVYYVKVQAGFDGRGDEKQYNLIKESSIDTSHALGAAFYIIGIYEEPDQRTSLPDFGFSDESDEEVGEIDLDAIQKPLGFKKVGKPIWKEETLSSTNAARPAFLLFCQESEVEVKKMIQRYLEPQIKEATEGCVLERVHDGVSQEFRVIIEVKAIDNKA